MNIPNILTSIRFILIPVFYIVYFSSIKNSFIISIVIFFISGVTDVLDGYIARKFNMVTKWGSLLDPLADKLMVITVLFCLSTTDILPDWVFMLFLVKEFLMVAGGVNLLRYKKYIPARYYGKIATFLIYLSIGIMIFNEKIGNYILYGAIFMTLFAFANYIKSFITIYTKEHDH